MSKIKYTPQGFSYIEVSLYDVLSWGGFGVCNGCNRGPLKKMNLVFVLGDTYCEDCFNEWLERAKNYTQEDINADLRYQKQYHMKWYRQLLGKGYEEDENEY